MKNIILVDCHVDEDWEFKKALESVTCEKWYVHEVVSNRNHGGKIQNLIRYVKYFVTPLSVAVHKNQYKTVIGWQQFHALILAFYFRLFRVKKAPDIIVMTFIYKPKKSFIGKVYDKFMRYMVMSDYISKFIVYSTSERDYYSKLFGISSDKFVSVLLGCEDVSERVCKRCNGEYYLSAGRSNRDYKYLIKSWERNSRYRELKIISDMSGIQQHNNIVIYNKCFGVDFLEKLADSYAVIVPLDDSHVSSGQLVIIQAMMYGKPIIVTKNDTIYDYVTNGYNGIIIDKTSDELENAVKSLENKQIYEKLSINSRKCYEEKFSVYAMGCRVAELILGVTKGDW